MQQYMKYIIILACLLATFFLYNEQLASIPLLLLSAYLFYLFYKEYQNAKNDK